MRIDFKLEYSGIDYKKFTNVFRRRLGTTLNTFGRRTAAKMRRDIRSGSHAANNPIWAQAKGGRPLFHTGHLATAPKHKVYPGVGDVLRSVEVGILDNHTYSNRGGSIQIDKLAKVLISGATWTPSPEQRRAFWARMRSMGVTSNGNGRNQWRIPARKFNESLESPDTIALLEMYIQTALDMTIKETQTKEQLK